MMVDVINPNRTARGRVPIFPLSQHLVISILQSPETWRNRCRALPTGPNPCRCQGFA